MKRDDVAFGCSLLFGALSPFIFLSACKTARGGQEADPSSPQTFICTTAYSSNNGNLRVCMNSYVYCVESITRGGLSCFILEELNADTRH